MWQILSLSLFLLHWLWHLLHQIHKVIFRHGHLGDSSRDTLWHRHLSKDIGFLLRLLDFWLFYDVWLFYWFFYWRLLRAYGRLSVDVFCGALFLFLRSQNLIPVIIRLNFCKHRGRLVKLNFFYFFDLFKRGFWL